MGEAGGEGEWMKRWGAKEGGADTLTDWLRSPNTWYCLQPRLARGLGQHNLCVLDNSRALQLPLDTCTSTTQYFTGYLRKTHISRFESLAHVCARMIDRERERQTAGPGIHGNPSQVHWFICDSGNSTYDEKHAYKVSGIQMHSIFFFPSVFILNLSLSLSLWTLPHGLLHAHMSWHLPQCPAWVADMIFPVGVDWGLHLKIRPQCWQNISDMLLIHSILQKSCLTPRGTCYTHRLGSWFG